MDQVTKALVLLAIAPWLVPWIMLTVGGLGIVVYELLEGVFCERSQDKC
jgi:hypothetical protein